MQCQKIFLFLFFSFFSLSIFSNNNIEKIVMIRHGEKTAVETGQLNCQGLNRSLMLPDFFEKNFGKPDFIFAPNPSVQISKHSSTEKFSYVRPLATIEPTAIYFSLPINAQIGFNQPEVLMQTLLDPQYHHSVIFVAWEHKNIEKFAHLLSRYFNSTFKIAAWHGNNFAMAYVFTIDWNKKPATLQFQVMNENLHHISKECFVLR